MGDVNMSSGFVHQTQMAEVSLNTALAMLREELELARVPGARPSMTRLRKMREIAQRAHQLCQDITRNRYGDEFMAEYGD